jgi:hypothetical protein
MLKDNVICSNWISEKPSGSSSDGAYASEICSSAVSRSNLISILTRLLKSSVSTFHRQNAARRRAGVRAGNDRSPLVDDATRSDDRIGSATHAQLRLVCQLRKQASLARNEAHHGGQETIIRLIHERVISNGKAAVKKKIQKPS